MSHSRESSNTSSEIGCFGIICFIIAILIFLSGCSYTSLEERAVAVPGDNPRATEMASEGRVYVGMPAAYAEIALGTPRTKYVTAHSERWYYVLQGYAGNADRATLYIENGRVSSLYSFPGRYVAPPLPHNRK